MSEAMNEAIEAIIQGAKRFEEFGVGMDMAVDTALSVWIHTHYHDGVPLVDDEDDDEPTDFPHSHWYKGN